ncbi:hypothetical protein [Dactylosporangium sp. CA-139066]|uniref:hypothetical protein n=1 Tax=Dactylosporangium sp. CA-139066 TaxID=3239930 RepID=UPI003D91E937
MADEETPTAEVETPSTASEPENKELTPDELKAALAAARKEAAGYRTKLREAEPYVAKARELEEAQKSDVEKLTAAQAAALARAEKAEAELLRLTAARAAGLDLDMADRLKGSTLEELTADAKALAEKFPANETPAVPRKPHKSVREVAPVPPGAADDESPAALASRIRGRRRF